MKHNLTTVKLSDIVLSETNPRNESGTGLDESNLKELSASIKQDGVIQPIVLRQNGSPGKYELVCGERRFRASKLAGLTEIPATVRELTDEQAFDLQITENLQRKDVHPLDEAIAFKSLFDKKQSIADIALRFGKPELFVVARIKLNDLIQKLKQDFYSGKFGIGQAFLMARLTPEEQQKSLNQFTEYNREYKSVKALSRMIDDVLCKLSSAPFKKDDAKLVEKAGPCTTCPKRSGANATLFGDFKEKDVCFDRACFNSKMQAHMTNVLTDIVQNRPEVHIIRSQYGEQNKTLEKVASDMKVKVLVSYKDFDDADSKAKNLPTGFYINGNQIGHFVKIRMTKGSNKSGTHNDDDNNNSSSEPSTSEQIEGIKMRQARAVELDAEKVYARVLDEFEKSLKDKKFKSNQAEEAAMWWMMIDKGDDYTGTISKGLSLGNISDAKNFPQVFKRLCKLTPQEKSFIIRNSFYKNYSGNYPSAMYGALLRNMATQTGVPISKFIKEQDEIKAKREVRAAVRIADLKNKSAKKEVKKEKPIEKKKSKKV